MASRLPGNIYLLGLLSLFNDISSDMVTPLLPAYLATLGLGAGFLGWLEGAGNALSHMTTLFSGYLDDRLHRSKALAVWGYRISAFFRIFLAVPIPGVIFAARFLDRIGKGIRTAPRDHLLTRSLERGNWGKAFGVQRAMDHTGALLGPPIAMLLLWLGISYSKLFLIAAVPALISILIIPHWIREKPSSSKGVVPRLQWKGLPSPLKRYVGVIFFAALSTPSELFLILKLQELGLPAYYSPVAWALLTTSTMAATLLGGYLADRWSNRWTIGLGYLLFAGVFVAFAFNTHLSWAWALIALYGLQLGLVEAPERAYPANVVPPELRATALGWYYFAYGLGLLPASVLFGFFWNRFGSQTAFLIYAGMTLLVLPLLTWLPTHRDGQMKAVLLTGAESR